MKFNFRRKLNFYKLTMLKIDWNWVKKEVSKREHISKDAIRETFEECIDDARRLAKPKIAMSVKKLIAQGNDFVEIAGCKFVSKKLSKALNGASHLCLFLVTTGGRIEKAATKYMSQGDSLKGYFMDRLGSMAAESLAENTEFDLRKRYRIKGRSVSMRFSPGYCDWNIEEQFKLAKILKFSKAGVRLTDGCMMVPKKSISGIIGIGPAGLFKDIKPPCVSCGLKTCYYRR